MAAVDPPTSDVELIERAKASPEAFALLYRRYADRIYGYFWYRVGHLAEVAEDLMQETFTRAYRHRLRFAPRGVSYGAYLRRIAHNVLVNYYRRPQPLPLETVADAPVEVLEGVARRVEAEELWRAIQQLPPTDRDILLMKYHDDLPVRAIAGIVGKSENAVKLVLSRARKKLARHRRLAHLRQLARPHRPPSVERFPAASSALDGPGGGSQ